MTPEEHAANLAKRTREAYELLIGPLREVAKENGYALAVHGSLARDIDLIAVPWTSQAVEAHILAEAIRVKAEEINGHFVGLSPHESRDYFLAGCPGMKPHQRLQWSFHLFGTGSYIDLAVMPRVPDIEITPQNIEKLMQNFGKIPPQPWKEERGKCTPTKE